MEDKDFFEASGISVGLSRCSRCPIWCADATHTQNLAKSDPAHPLAGPSGALRAGSLRASLCGAFRRSRLEFLSFLRDLRRSSIRSKLRRGCS